MSICKKYHLLCKLLKKNKNYLDEIWNCILIFDRSRALIKLNDKREISEGRSSIKILITPHSGKKNISHLLDKLVDIRSLAETAWFTTLYQSRSLRLSESRYWSESPVLAVDLKWNCCDKVFFWFIYLR